MFLNNVLTQISFLLQGAIVVAPDPTANMIPPVLNGADQVDLVP